MKKTFIFSPLLLLISCQKSENITVESPSREVTVTISLSGQQVHLSAFKDGSLILHDCSLGLVVDSIDIGNDALLSGEVTEKTIREEYELLGNHSLAVNNCSEISIPLKSRGINYQLLVRAYNDGFAIRYMIRADHKMKINGENTYFTLPDSATCYWADYSESYEELHHISLFKEMHEDHPFVAPLTVKSGGLYLSFSEADCVDFPDMGWIKTGNAIKTTYPASPQGWNTQPSDLVSPWRLVIIADNLTGLVNSDLITNLCNAPASGTDFSWIKPGRVLWQWWSSGSPEFDDQKTWYDAAARLTWEYYLIDDGWRNWRQPGKDQWQCLKEVIEYGKSKGVKSLVWADSKEMRDRESLRSYLKKIKEVGAAGIKIDFIPPATPEIMQWYETAREEAYRLQLMCDFHGCVKPTGLRRTWPNEMTREGVRGNEYQMTRYNRLMPLDQDEIIPFTRFIAGPADFTPVIFNEKELRGYTWTHELAQAVVYCSPLTHFADSYQYYLDNPAEDILRDIPVSWDETLVLPCSEIGRVAAFARRKGDEWWVGIMNGKDTVNLSVNLDFLSGGASAIILSDKTGVPNSFVREEKEVKRSDRINICLNPGGGYFMRLMQEEKKAQ